MAAEVGRVVCVASSREKKYQSLPEIGHISGDWSYAHLTSNNTIYGTQWQQFPTSEVPLVCDMSSDIFSREIDFSAFDMIYACAQKNLGIAGVSLVIIKKEFLRNQQIFPADMLNYQKHIEAKNLLNTPPVFAIYMCYEMLQWIELQGGVKKLEELNRRKAEILYSEIDRNSLFTGIAVKESRSIMNATFRLNNLDLEPLFNQLCAQENICGVEGHRRLGGYRVSMYNAVRYSSVEKLVGIMQLLEKQA